MSFCPVFRPKQQKTARNCAVSAFWSEIDGITHIIFLPCSFAIRNIFFFAHYGSLQVRQVCARRKLAHPRIVTSFQCRVRHVFRSKQQKTAPNCAVSAFWSEIDGITHIVFLSCSFAIRDIFLFAHYGFLQVRQVCARRKLAHPRIVASLQCRVCSRLSLQLKED